MASFEDYDEFGNYIGADLISDDEDEDVAQNDFRTAQEPFQAAPLEGYEDEATAAREENALMEIDGVSSSLDNLLNFVHI
jgi:U5 small nuclear ribonucleoprotein component